MNLRRGLFRVWLLVSTMWIVAAPAWTDVSDELEYAFQYFTSREALREKQISAGACVDIGFHNAAATVFAKEFAESRGKKMSPPAADIANAERDLCEQDRQILKRGEAVGAPPKSDCLFVWSDALRREKEAEDERKKIYQQEIEATAKATEKLCLVQHTPETPRLNTTIWVIAAPTLGVALVALLAFVAFRVMRWVAIGFKGHP